MNKFAPLRENHPLVGEICPVCKETFCAGDKLTLIPTYPASPEDARKAQQGLAHTKAAQPVHWDCRGEPDLEL